MKRSYILQAVGSLTEKLHLLFPIPEGYEYAGRKKEGNSQGTKKVLWGEPATHILYSSCLKYIPPVCAVSHCSRASIHSSSIRAQKPPACKVASSLCCSTRSDAIPLPALRSVQQDSQLAALPGPHKTWPLTTTAQLPMHHHLPSSQVACTHCTATPAFQLQKHCKSFIYLLGNQF